MQRQWKSKDLLVEPGVYINKARRNQNYVHNRLITGFISFIWGQPLVTVFNKKGCCFTS